ncbi:DUF3265 domain-containing protein [Vibrio vulnificus]|nr:DUF3265 domain-containing protein [Vibrio vulnificus]
MNLGGENGLRKLGLCGIHPLTQRYNYVAFLSSLEVNSYCFA